jgi:hypothetical protein
MIGLFGVLTFFGIHPYAICRGGAQQNDCINFIDASDIWPLYFVHDAPHF